MKLVISNYQNYVHTYKIYNRSRIVLYNDYIGIDNNSIVIIT